MSGYQGYGWSHLLWGGPADASTNSFVENNVFVVPLSTGDDNFVAAMEAGAGPGITSDFNLYSGTAPFLSVDTDQNFSAWKSAHSGWDQNSINSDAKLADQTEFNQTAAEKPVYDWSKAIPLTGSPARRAGVDESASFTVDFTGAPRAAGPYDMGAVAIP